MEEMINQDLIKKLRSEKCWSQEHLALISGISLRTVQRIENEGRCSIDSKQALAAALEIDVSQLSIQPGTNVLAANDSKLEAAISWLDVVDSGDYDLSWEEASPLFQSKISSKKWIKTLAEVRGALGKVTSRTVKNASEHISLPGVPDGKYIVITLATNFDLKQSAIETITLNKTNDDWRVTGYFIK